MGGLIECIWGSNYDLGSLVVPIHLFMNCILFYAASQVLGDGEERLVPTKVFGERIPDLPEEAHLSFLIQHGPYQDCFSVALGP